MASPDADAPLIRLARSDDRDAVERCVHEAYVHDVPRIGRKPAPMLADYARLIAAGRVHVVPGPSGILAVLVTEPHETWLLIENVAVLPSHQGRGLGSRLLAWAEQLARAAGLDELRLYTNERMIENQRFYRHRGFVELERRTEDGYARVYMRRQLDS
ncbi:MAG TPA: GNAT family N-acetyltransferase [Vicinamibacterales bacterium]|nr:GNAT family N-acetyltransferase [Vicinamibacterales bacterium]